MYVDYAYDALSIAPQAIPAATRCTQASRATVKPGSGQSDSATPFLHAGHTTHRDADTDQPHENYHPADHDFGLDCTTHPVTKPKRNKQGRHSRPSSTWPVRDQVPCSKPYLLAFEGPLVVSRLFQLSDPKLQIGDKSMPLRNRLCHPMTSRRGWILQATYTYGSLQENMVVLILTCHGESQRCPTAFKTCFFGKSSP